MFDPFDDPANLPSSIDDGLAPPRNGIGTAALALGMAGIAISWIPLIGVFGWTAGLLAVVFGAIGLRMAARGTATNRGAAAGGLFSGLAAVAVGALLITISGQGVGLFDDRTDAAATAAASGEPEAEATEEPGIGDGLWTVGTDIAPGTYVAEVTFSCTVERRSGLDGTPEQVIGGGIFTGGAHLRLTIAETDAAVMFDGGCEWRPATEETLLPLDDDLQHGIFEVGTEIAPGTYVTEAPETDGYDTCQAARLSGFGMTWDEIIADTAVEGGDQGVIEIAATDVGVQFSGWCVWRLQ